MEKKTKKLSKRRDDNAIAGHLQVLLTNHHNQCARNDVKRNCHAFTLAEGTTCVATPNWQRIAAFTLAEVLITLGIIGVVAAMTLPTLVANYKYTQYVTGVKKAMNVSTNMFVKMQADEGVTELSHTEIYSGYSGGRNSFPDGYSDPDGYDAIIPKYLNVVKICKGIECSNLYYIDSSQPKNKLVDGIPISDAHSDTFRGYYTVDGMIYYINAGCSGIGVIVDVNGDKAPNTVGIDTFKWAFCAEKSAKLRPVNYFAGDVCEKEEHSDAGREQYEQDSSLSKLMRNDWKMDKKYFHDVGLIK